MPSQRILLAIALAIAVTGCGRDTKAEPAPSTAATPPVVSCSGERVGEPGLVALKADGLASCWSALSDTNTWVTGVHDQLVIVSTQACAAAEVPIDVVALNAATGKEVWRAPAIGWAAGVSDGIVLAFSEGSNRSMDDGARAIDAATGRQHWELPGAMIVADGSDVVVVALGEEGDSGHAVVDRRTGQERWRTPASDAYAAAVAGDVVAFSDGESTTAYDAKTGKERWSAAFGAGEGAPIFGMDDVVIGTSEYGTVEGHDAASGTRLWKQRGYPVRDSGRSGPTLYVSDSEEGSETGPTVAVDPRTGEPRWRVDAGLTPGVGFVLAKNAQEYQALDPQTGAVRWRVPVVQVSDLPSPADSDSVESTGVLPTEQGVFFSYGRCLGS